jgi:hypothetical protein
VFYKQLIIYIEPATCARFPVTTTSSLRTVSLGSLCHLKQFIAHLMPTHRATLPSISERKQATKTVNRRRFTSLHDRSDAMD